MDYIKRVVDVELHFVRLNTNFIDKNSHIQTVFDGNTDLNEEEWINKMLVSNYNINERDSLYARPVKSALLHNATNAMREKMGGL